MAGCRLSQENGWRVSNLSKPNLFSMTSVQGRWISLLLGGAVALAFLNAGAGFVALKKLEKKAGAPVRGIFLPYFCLPIFRLKDPKFDWQGLFQVQSGSIQVRYDPFFLIPGWKFRVRITGGDLRVRLSGKLAEEQGFSEIKVDRVVADFALRDEGPPEVYWFDVQSKQMQFRLAKEEETDH